MMKSEDDLSRLRHTVRCIISQSSASPSFQREYIDSVAFFPLCIRPLELGNWVEPVGLVVVYIVVVLAQFHQKLTLKLTLRPRT